MRIGRKHAIDIEKEIPRTEKMLKGNERAKIKHLLVFSPPPLGNGIGAFRKVIAMITTALCSMRNCLKDERYHRVLVASQNQSLLSLL